MKWEKGSQHDDEWLVFKTMEADRIEKWVSINEDSQQLSG